MSDASFAQAFQLLIGGQPNTRFQFPYKIPVNELIEQIDSNMPNLTENLQHSASRLKQLFETKFGTQFDSLCFRITDAAACFCLREFLNSSNECTYLNFCKYYVEKKPYNNRKLAKKTLERCASQAEIYSVEIFMQERMDKK